VRILSLALIMSFLLSIITQAQEKCATVPYMKNLLQKKGIPENTDQFEQWLQSKIAQRKTSVSNAKQQASPYQVPVVVHVVHNGQAIGVGVNITDTRIKSQIDVLNEDFNRLNSDAINTPSAFVPLAGSMNIEFVLAKSDPEGLPTTGIVRVNGGKATWSASSESDMAALKQKSYWSSDDYLNIWVTDLANNYLGLAQFPVSNLPGLEDYQDGLAETDGVVIDHTVFGVGSPDSQYNLGRTTTHEMGHFFGLRHIWGDDLGGSCAGTDYANDTPNQGSETLNVCPSTVRTDACTTTAPGIMYQNFMDYTDDACMNIFTKDQITRMVTIIESSPRRESLLHSPGLVAPSGLGEDLKITTIISPSAVSCSNASLKFNMANVGSPTIISFKVNTKIDDGSTITTSFPNDDYPVVNILSGEVVEVTLPLDIDEGVKSIYFQVHTPNGVSDANPNNSDTLMHVLIDNQSEAIPLREQFDNTTTNWSKFNPTNGTLWEDASTYFNNSVYFRAYNNEEVGEKSWLVSPILDFRGLNTASALFDYSYGYNGFENDRLKILASTDCGNTYPTTLFDRSGQNLKTYYPATNEFFAKTQADWKVNQYLNLNSLAGKSGVRLAFVMENQGGNNVFVDNVEFFMSDNPLPVDPGAKPFVIYWDDNWDANITFNLAEKQNVDFTLTDMMGREVHRTILPDILNQTVLVPVGLSSRGLYIVRLHIDKKYYNTKIYVSP